MTGPLFVSQERQELHERNEKRRETRISNTVWAVLIGSLMVMYLTATGYVGVRNAAAYQIESQEWTQRGVL